MRKFDVAIVGGGLAGATAAAMLGRKGIPSVVIDPHLVYPPDFRCEKLGGSQLKILAQCGLEDAILPHTTPDKEMWNAIFGRVVEKTSHDHVGIDYDALVNAMRAAVKAPAQFRHAKVAGIATSDDSQVVTLSNGETVGARLVLLATGLGTNLRNSLGMERIVLSPAHTLSIGFDISPAGRQKFDFRALTYFPERPSNQMAYLTIFPIGQRMRANFFVYRDLRDPWLKSFKTAPVETLNAALPRLKRILGEFTIDGTVDIRPMDVYAVRNCLRSGVVLAGDAYSTSCPAVGMGVGKVLTDVERLCNVYIPRWLESPGMGTDKIAAFYADPVKQASEEYSRNKAFFMRSLYTKPGLIWTARRWMRFFAYGLRGALRYMGDHRRPRPGELTPAVPR